MGTESDKILSCRFGQAFNFLMAAPTGFRAVCGGQCGRGVFRAPYVMSSMAVAAPRSARPSERLYLAVECLLIRSIEILVAGSAFSY